MISKSTLLNGKTCLTVLISLTFTPVVAQNLVIEDGDLRLTSGGGLFGGSIPRDEVIPPVNLESPHVHPLDLSQDELWLAAANTFGDKVELFEIVDGIPIHRRSVFTGLDPVSVRFRTKDE